MGILRAEMLATDTRHVQQKHDLPEENVVQVDALSESLLSLKNDGDSYRCFVDRVICDVRRSLQQAQVNMADRAHTVKTAVLRCHAVWVEQLESLGSSAAWKNEYMWYKVIKLYHYIVIHISQFIRSISCTVIPRLTKIIRSRITFVSQNLR